VLENLQKSFKSGDFGALAVGEVLVCDADCDRCTSHDVRSDNKQQVCF
jgi:hypothetical protein